ncbi:MAG TPA: HAD hydrolase-like protein, partial [Lysobacter sp.]
MSERPLPFAPDAVLLDMDGLMLDSERALLECWQQASAEQGVDVDAAFWLSMVGLHESECMRMLRERLGRGPADALRERCHALYSARV